MLQKKLYTTSTTRFANKVELLDLTLNKGSCTLPHKKNIKVHKKIFYKKAPKNVSYQFSLNLTGVVQAFSYNIKPYQLLLNVKNIYGLSYVIPGIDMLRPGKKLFNLTKNIEFKKIYFMGACIFLKDAPYNMIICYIMNSTNNKWTFAKSSGTYGVKQKGKKTIKLILIKLPSTEIYFFPQNIRCYIGRNKNFYNNKYNEGKWGFSLHKTKVISVRGVAMNPVDHPNGGRTKSKQPEKSPWGWIAKQKK